MKAIGVLGVLLLLAPTTRADDRRFERGLPSIHVYGQRIHRGGPQTFDVAQDRRGVLYFGNLGGLLVYDGAWWRMLHLPQDAAAYAVESDARGRILVGDVNMLGEARAVGDAGLSFVSVVEQLPSSDRAFGEVRAIVSTQDAFLIVTEKLLLRYSDRLSVVKRYSEKEPAPVRTFVAAGMIWTSSEQGVGRLDPRSGRESVIASLAGKKLDAASTYAPGVALLALRDEGLFLADAGGVRPFSAASAAWLRGKRVSGSAITHDGRVVVTTRLDGMIVLRHDGEIDQIVDSSAGLPEDTLAMPFCDRDGTLWLAFHGPIARIDLESPVSVIDSRRGVKGSIAGAYRFAGRLYIAGSHGAYVLDPASHPLVPRKLDVTPPVQALTVAGDELLMSTSRGLVSIDAGGAMHPVAGADKVIIYAMLPSKLDPNRVWVATQEDLRSLVRSPGGWTLTAPIRGSRPYIGTMVEEGTTLWCGTIYDGVQRVANAAGRSPVVTLVGEPEEMSVAEVDGAPRFVRASGEILALSNGKLVPDPQLGRIRVPDGFFLIAQDRRRNVWLNSIPPRVVPRSPSGRYSDEAHPLVQVDASDIQFLRADDGIVWFGSDRGLYRYELQDESKAGVQPPPLISRAAVGEKSVPLTAEGGRLPHAFGRLRIEFAPASYRAGVSYQYRLEPLDHEWSDWTDQAFIDYTSLPEGEYRFFVRARGASTAPSQPAVFAFTVDAPWYRTRLAILAWIGFALVALFALIRFRTRSLTRQAEALRVRIADRTEELRSTVDQLRSAQSELLQKNELLEQLSLVDDLTGVANRRSFQRSLLEEWNRAMRRRNSLTLILIDVDHFKELNDNRGHAAGDDSLREIASFLARNVRRAGDVVARYGGEEFAVLLPATDSDEATQLAHKLRLGVEALGLRYDASSERRVTVSCGVASARPNGETQPATMVERADSALYAAKKNGRNRVEVADEEASEVVLR